MESVKLVKKVWIKPSFINDDVNTHVYDKINNQYTGTCTQSYGYVLSVNPDVKILNNQVSDNGSIMFDVEFTVNSLKPKVGQVLKGVICMIFEEGVFVEVKKCIKILIPVTRLNMEYNQDKNVFSREEKTICLHDEIDVKIDQIRYDKRRFNIIGDLVV